MCLESIENMLSRFFLYYFMWVINIFNYLVKVEISNDFSNIYFWISLFDFIVNLFTNLEKFRHFNTIILM